MSTHPSIFSKEIIYNINRIDQLRNSPDTINLALFELLERHSPPTASHSQEVFETTWQLLSKIDSNNRQHSLTAARFHDIGKLLVPEWILRRENNHSLLDNDQRILNNHPKMSGEILNHLSFNPVVVKLAFFHHHDFCQIRNEQDLYQEIEIPIGSAWYNFLLKQSEMGIKPQEGFSIVGGKYITVQVFLPSLLRLADSISAAKDMTRLYQPKPSIVRFISNLRDKCDDVRIQSLLLFPFFSVIKDEELAFLSDMPLSSYNR